MKINFTKACKVLLLLVCTSVALHAQVVGVIDTLRLNHFENIEDRAIYVWKPTDYNAKQVHNVLLMHDGQMLFDATKTWNKQEWRADEIADSLIKRKLVPPFIIVAIPNVEGYRTTDYFPEDPFYNIPMYLQKELLNTQKADINSNNYLEYLGTHVMPAVRAKYNVSANSTDVCLAGASMGGLISWYGLCNQTEVFGNAICMSTHWPGANPTKYGDTIFSAFKDYLANTGGLRYAARRGGKLYFDCGDKTLDAFYPSLQKKIDFIVRGKEFNYSNTKTVYATDADHTENAWSKRLADAIIFIYKKD
jgi:enterochelin esterase-like enzyme